MGDSDSDSDSDNDSDNNNIITYIILVSCIIIILVIFWLMSSTSIRHGGSECLQGINILLGSFPADKRSLQDFKDSMIQQLEEIDC